MTASETDPVVERVTAPSHRRRPFSAPALRSGVCRLAQPCIRQVQRTPRFLFSQATVLLVTSGSLQLEDDTHDPLTADVPSMLLVDPGTTIDLVKRPAPQEGVFRSIFLELSPEILRAFRGAYPEAYRDAEATGSPRSARIALDRDLVDVRMHHAMMLLHTTTWGVDQVAHASGYRSRARFSGRFRDRFGYLPSAVR